MYPGVPIELVVSIGTGVIKETTSTLQSIGWDLLVNQLIASSTDTEDVHSLLHDFLPSQSYFRFNPILPNNTAIDEKAKSILQSLKDYSKEYYKALEVSEVIEQRKRFLEEERQPPQLVYEDEEEDDDQDGGGGGGGSREGMKGREKQKLSSMIKRLYGK